MLRFWARLGAMLGVLSGCGGGEPLSLGSLPLADGVRVQAQSYECPFAPEQCFRYAIITSTAGTPSELLAVERQALIARGWRLTPGITKRDVAAYSRDGKRFVSLSTAHDLHVEELTGRLSWSDRLRGELLQLAASGQGALATTMQTG